VELAVERTVLRRKQEEVGMSDIPLHADVMCADGPCGESMTVIVNPVTRKVTHIVVRDKTFPPPIERLVPLEHVAETTSDSIRLSCTKAEAAAMEPFLEVQYIETDTYAQVYPHYDVYMAPYVVPTGATVKLPMEVERVPPGQLAFRRGTRVEASDGYIGTVGELLIEPESGQITHIVLKEGHLWGKRELTLPLSAIDRVEDEGIDLVARVFDDPGSASKALKVVEDLHRRGKFKILNAAVLAKDEDGKVNLRDVKDIDPKRGGLFGAITGGLVGLLGGPVGVVVGALVGAGAGGLIGKWVDKGFSDRFLTELQEQLKPGSSALVVLLEHHWLQPMSESLSDLGGMVFEQTITDTLVDQLLADSDTEE
jgi:uncharacterized membrane protein